MQSWVRWLVLAVVAAAAVAVGWTVTSLFIGGGTTASLNRALIGGPFTLTDQHGQRVSDAAFRGRLMLVYFGYTYCPDVCPTELQNMSQALDLLGPAAAGVQPLFITIDPQRDTAGQLAEYMTSFHPGFLALTGTPEEIDAAAKAYRVYYARAREPGGSAAAAKSDSYLMDHSGYVYLMGRDGQYLSHFAPNTDPQKMAEKIRQYL
jgi:protein SCO1/2